MKNFKKIIFFGLINFLSAGIFSVFGFWLLEGKVLLLLLLQMIVNGALLEVGSNFHV